MARTILTRGCVLPAILIATVAWAGAALAQIKVTRGFDVAVRPQVSGDELNRQPDLWALQITYKPMRMLPVEITDPKTGEKKQELIWYLIYKVVNAKIDRPVDAADLAPVNTTDPPPEPKFVPEFSIVTEDDGQIKIYPDQVLPEAQRAIARRERQANLKNSVEIVGPLPPSEQEGEGDAAVYGLATWRAVDSTTDYFTLYLTGFSSGYRITKGPDGNDVVWRRTIEHQFWRPGDEFDEDEREFRERSQARWIYRPDAAAGVEAEPVTDPDSPAGEAKEGDAAN